MEPDKTSWQMEVKSTSPYDVNNSSQQNTPSTPENPKDKFIEDFSSYTTLHGFHFILDSKSIWRRALWCLLIIGGTAFLVVQLYISITKLYALEYDTKKSVEDSKTLPFPAVTICNRNMMRKSQIMGTIAQEYLDQMDQIKFLYAGLKQKDLPSFDVQKTLKKVGHQLPTMIPVCIFAGTSCSMEKDWRPALSSYLYGLCYTFNANGSKDLVGEGTRGSLKLELNAEPDEYYGPYSYESTGFKIAIHEPGTYHDIDNEGYDVSPGFFTTLRIKRKKKISLRPPFKSMCGSINLENFGNYSQTGCYHTCVSKKLADKCQCRFLSMVEKGINFTRFCNVSEVIKCIGPSVSNILKENSPSSCGCPRSCQEIEYTVKSSLSYYPSLHLWDAILPFLAQQYGLNTSDPDQKSFLQADLRKRKGIMQIYYENLQTDVTEETPTYQLSQFGSDVGGNMGLFLGCSLLTLFEFIDLIIMICLHRSRKTKTVMNVQ